MTSQSHGKPVAMGERLSTSEHTWELDFHDHPRPTSERSLDLRLLKSSKANQESEVSSVDPRAGNLAVLSRLGRGGRERMMLQ